MVLSILAMERPVSSSAEDIRNEKVKVLWSIPPVAREDTLLSQYVVANGKLGYLGDDTIPRNSVCPTYTALTLWINNPRWEGVPFILKAGKALNEAKVDICIQFKDVTQGRVPQAQYEHAQIVHMRASDGDGPDVQEAIHTANADDSVPRRWIARIAHPASSRSGLVAL